jgi:hypothetical protein
MPQSSSAPSELAAQAWLQSLPELRDVEVVIGWDSLATWDGQQTLITIDDVLSKLPGKFVVPSCVQIDVWSPDQAGRLAQIIWRAAEPADVDRLSGPKFVPDQGGRWSLDLGFRAPVTK